MLTKTLPYDVDVCLSTLQKEDPQIVRTKELQRRDTELSEIIDFLQNYVVPVDDKSVRKLLLTSDSFYISQDGLLYHLDHNRKRCNKDQFSQFVIPQDLKFEVSSNVHDHVSGAHFGDSQNFSKG